jgi:lipopolysaccharide transport protein LptA
MNMKAIRAVLVAVCVGLVAVVALSLRRTPVTPVGPAAGPSPKPATETRQTHGLYRIYKEGKERTTIEYGALVGQEGEAMRLRSVTVKSLYVSEGQEGTVTIRSDEALYNEEQGRVVFRGHVKVVTADGLEVESDDLIYRSDRATAHTDGPARYVRKGLTGSSKGVQYDGDSGRIAMPADVSFRIEGDAGQPPTLIKSRRATVLRAQGLMRFQGDVALDQGRDKLRSEDLALSFDPETRLVRTATATGKVVLKTSGSAVLPGMQAVAAAAGGTRDLQSRRLFLGFRPDRTLEKAIAGGGARLVLLPGPKQRQERRTIDAEVLTFEFDAAGRAERLRGNKDCRMLAENLGSDPQPRLVTADRIRGKLDPETGEAQRMDFEKDVTFSRPDAKATSGFARYSHGASLRLQEDPKIQQETGDLQADTIDIIPETGDVNASGKVRHLLRRRSGAARTGLLSGQDAPTLVTSRRFAYQQAKKSALYEGDALLRSGRDEIKAPKLVLEEDAKGARRLLGSQGVVSLLHPKSSKPGDPEPAAVEGRGADMLYEEGAGRIVYTGDVTIRQGDIQTVSPKATITLTADGNAVEKLVAGEPVAVQQGIRKANGRRGVYTPGNETMVLTGENVVLVEADRQTRGRSLTFKVGDDTILVDGEEEGRTETILKQATAPITAPPSAAASPSPTPSPATSPAASPTPSPRPVPR